MMTNLFSTFDPSSSMLKVSWTLTMMLALLMPKDLWKMDSTMKVLMYTMVKTFKKEVSYTLKTSKKGTEPIIMTTFLVVLMANFVALYPQVFSVTAHIAVTLPLSLVMWSTIVSFGWTKNTKHMLAHLLPQGTPLALMNFMVLIEMTSNLIRPITLCVRLTANMIAGHLLMSLLGGALLSMSMETALISILTPMILTVLESAVACIQAYVFMTLITLYLTEI